MLPRSGTRWDDRAVIIVTITIDIDDPSKIGDWQRKIVATAPRGYTVEKAECSGWKRSFETGSVTMDVCFRVRSPEDVLPRIQIRAHLPAANPPPDRKSVPAKPNKKRR